MSWHRISGGQIVAAWIAVELAVLLVVLRIVGVL
jgi:hypothetical protein